MKRLLAVAVLSLAALAAVLPQAGAATNEIKLCKKDGGWQISAGNAPPQFPKTKCSFAVSVYDQLANRSGGLDNLPKRFQVNESGKKLRCKAKSSGSYAEFRCKGSDRFVLAYKFK